MIAAQLFSILDETALAATAPTLGTARICLLDWLACALAGSREAVVDAIIASAETAGGRYPIVGRAEMAGLRDSVLINGVASHAIDYDDGLIAMMGHPAAAIIAPLLGLAMAQQIEGERLLRGIVAAYEAAGRIGSMLSPDHYARGFHATGTVGAMAAALAGAWMAGLPEEVATSAFGLAATRAAGLKASFGSDAKPLHAGWAGMVALTAIQWAQAGMRGQGAILEHRQGVGSAMSTSFDPERGLEPRELPHIVATTFKQHAACGVTHPAIRAAQALRQDVNGAGIGRVRIRITAQADDICNVAQPITGLQLKFSLRGVVAMTMLGIDTARPESYSDETCAREDLQALVARTDVLLNAGAPIGPTTVEIDTNEGRTLVALDPGNKVLDFDVNRRGASGKFASIATPLLGQSVMEQIRDLVLDGELTDLAGLLAMTNPEANRPAAAGTGNSAALQQ